MLLPKDDRPGCERSSKAMLEVATPDLYRVNAFRVLGLPVTSRSDELAKQQKKLRLIEKLGASAGQNERGLLPLDPAPDGEAIRKATHRLRDPETRLVDELFWFWPLNRDSANDDEAFRLLGDGDLAGASDVWSKLQQDQVHRHVAQHNLAVLYHAHALDLEQRAEVGRMAPKAQTKLDRTWRLALQCWRAVEEDDMFWDCVVARVHVIDDPRLTAGTVRRLREALPVVLMKISIGLAVRAAKTGDAPGAHRHAQYLMAGGFDQSAVTAILEEEAAPIVDQIKMVCESVPAKSKSEPDRADELAEKIAADTQPLIAALDALLGAENRVCQGAHNTVAEAVRACTIDYGNETEKWKRCIELLNLARGIAVDDGLRVQLQEDISRVETNSQQEQEYRNLKASVTGNQVYEVTLAKSGGNYQELAKGLGLLKMLGDGGGFRASVPGVCACCLGKPDGEQSVSREWEETRGLTRYKRTLSFAFPICGRCRQHRAEYHRKQCLLVLVAAGLSTGIVYLVATQMNAAEWVPFVLLGGLLTTVLLFLCSSFIRLSVLAEEHACRDAAVEMSSASDYRVTFRFHNPLYADAFAKANNTCVEAHSYIKPPRGCYLVRGRPAILVVLTSLVLGVCGHSIVYAAMQDEWKQKRAGIRQDYAPRSAQDSHGTLPFSGRSSPKPTPPRYSSSGLGTRIESGKAHVRTLESEISAMDADLESLSNRIDRYRQEVEGYERQARLGLNVSESLHQQALDNHNSLVKQYNGLLINRNAKYAEYKREIESVNDMVRRYNSGER